MANGSETVFDRIARKRGDLSSAELKVADLVLTLPEFPLSASMRALARRAQVSDATVLRFCRLLGLDGYSDFKLEIARAVGNTGTPPPEPSTHHGIAAGIATLGDDLREQARSIAASIDPWRLDEIARRVAEARCLDIFAFGVSRVAGLDFANHLTSRGLLASVVSDPHMQAVRASRMTETSAALFLSIGFSRLLSDIAAAAREAGAFTVAVTTSGTPLSSTCARSIELPLDPSANAGVPRRGRYAQLIVLDAIAERVRASLGHEDSRNDGAEHDPRFSF